MLNKFYIFIILNLLFCFPVSSESNSLVTECRKTHSNSSLQWIDTSLIEFIDLDEGLAYLREIERFYKKRYQIIDSISGLDSFPYIQRKVTNFIDFKDENLLIAYESTNSSNRCMFSVIEAEEQITAYNTLKYQSLYKIGLEEHLDE